MASHKHLEIQLQDYALHDLKEAAREAANAVRNRDDMVAFARRRGVTIAELARAAQTTTDEIHKILADKGVMA